MHIDIDNRQTQVELSEPALQEFFLSCLKRVALERAELSVVLLDPQEMAELNFEQLGHEGPTDVLSFPQLELDPADPGESWKRELEKMPGGALLPLGDVVLCPAVLVAPGENVSADESESGGNAVVRAAAAADSPEERFRMAAVHGLLHLMGHDHAQPEEATAMAAEQARLLTAVPASAIWRGTNAIEATHPPADYRSGFVALVGRPNVGKSTLMNRLIGEKVSITSHKPQTTRNRILGIHTQSRGQVLFVDTPGIHDARDSFNRRLVRTALRSLHEADVVCYMVEPPAEFGPEEEHILSEIGKIRKKKVLVINKVDQLKDKRELLPLIDRFRLRDEWDDVFPVSALRGDNLDRLLPGLLELLPLGPPLFPSDQMTDQTERFLVAERVREQIFRQLREEIPYAVHVFVTHWEETPDLTRILGEIHVERKSQKGIVIGKRGATLKQISTVAREDLERFFGCKIFLRLQVVVTERWRRREPFLQEQNF